MHEPNMIDLSDASEFIKKWHGINYPTLDCRDIFRYVLEKMESSDYDEKEHLLAELARYYTNCIDFFSVTAYRDGQIDATKKILQLLNIKQTALDLLELDNETWSDRWYQNKVD